jgi:hypothetical protein
VERTQKGTGVGIEGIDEAITEIAHQVMEITMAVSRGRAGNRRAGMIIPPCESYKYGILAI